MIEITKLIDEKKPTIPFSLGADKKLNPFFRCDDFNFKKVNNITKMSEYESFEYLRTLKDNF